MEEKYRSHLIGKKEYNELGKTVSLMLKMCRYIFGLGKAVVLESGFWVTKVTTEF